jgi:hypothetical protein
MASELKSFVDIDAPPERVWHVLTDLPSYPEWNPFVRAAEGAMVEGAQLSLTVQPEHPLLRTPWQPTVLEMTPGRRLRLHGRMDRLGLPGLLAADVTLTVDDRDRGVRVWQQQRFQGLLVPLVSAFLNSSRLPLFSAMGEALKERAEHT